MIRIQTGVATHTEDPQRSVPRRPVAAVAAVYAASGALWIVGSEWLVGMLVPADQAVLAQVVKGVGFVAVTSVALYFILGRMVRHLQHSARTQASLASEVRTRAREQRSLTHRLMQAEEETRRSLAKDLHDGPLQALTLTFMQLDAAARAAEDEGALDPDRVSAAMDAIREASEDIRAVVRDLHPPLLAELGLSAAIERHCRDTALRVKRDVLFEGERSLPPLGTEASIAVFRILQEALANALKHTQHGPVLVTLEAREDGVHLSVQDEGPGFTPGAVRSTTGGGLGLVSMRERAESVGADFALQSSPSSGTTITVRLSPHGAPGTQGEA